MFARRSSREHNPGRGSKISYSSVMPSNRSPGLLYGTKRPRAAKPAAQEMPRPLGPPTRAERALETALREKLLSRLSPSRRRRVLPEQAERVLTNLLGEIRSTP